MESGTCGSAGTPENAAWIAALRWVVGDAAHRTAYDAWYTVMIGYAVQANDAETLRAAFCRALFVLETAEHAAERLKYQAETENCAAAQPAAEQPEERTD